MVAAADAGLVIQARVRSTGEPAPARLTLTASDVAVVFETPEFGVAPGQACVVYDGREPSRLLGGGFIARTGQAPAAH